MVVWWDATTAVKMVGLSVVEMVEPLDKKKGGVKVEMMVVMRDWQMGVWTVEMMAERMVALLAALMGLW